MRLALSEAGQAYAKGEIPVGVVVVCRDRIIARGYNLTETLNDVTAHAEMQAITAAASALGGKYLQECIFYVTLEPCTMCAGALGWAQIATLVYGASDEKKGYTKYAPDALHPKTTVIKGIMQEDCAKLMTDFFKSRR
jgi:tRNA(adenine34) deaminase